MQPNYIPEFCNFLTKILKHLNSLYDENFKIFYFSSLQFYFQFLPTFLPTKVYLHLLSLFLFFLFLLPHSTHPEIRPWENQILIEHQQPQTEYKGHNPTLTTDLLPLPFSTGNRIKKKKGKRKTPLKIQLP